MNPIEYFLLFLKASLFSTGGFGNLPSLHQDLLAHGWATEVQFGQSIALGQISPGPNGLWVIALGYLTNGYLGAFLALVAITIPPFVVLLFAAIYRRFEHSRWVNGLMRGISLAIVGLVLTIVWTLVEGSGLDWKNLLFGGAAFGLGMSRKLGVFAILALAAIAGLLIY